MWWVDADCEVKVASADKRFVVGFPLGWGTGEPLTVTVTGAEFVGLTPADKRPVLLTMLGLSSPTLGGQVHDVLRWAFDAERVLDRGTEPSRFR